MEPPRPLEVAGYDGLPMPCVLHPADDARGVAVVFPGSSLHGHRLGGTPARPDLHYTRAVLRLERLDVFEVWWDATSAPHGDDLERWLDENVAAALAAASEAGELALLAGRSLGTHGLARALTTAGARVRGLPTIWIAPLLRRAAVAAALDDLGGPGLVVAGSADHASDRAGVEALRTRGVDVVILEGADHGLEVESPTASARLLADALERMQTFVAAALDA